MKLSIQEAKDFFNEHGGERCQFRNKEMPWSEPHYLSAVKIDSEYPFLHINGKAYYECRRYINPERKIWTCETAPRNLMIRRKIWTKGTYIHVHISENDVWFVGSNGIEAISWKELAEDWEQFDGSPCYEVSE